MSTASSIRISLAILLTLAFASPALATNGDNLIGVGAVSRSMGGVGVAAPQDAISAILLNPAGMCTGPYCPGSQTVFSGTYFDPTVKATINVGGGPVSAKSQMLPFVIPAIGISSPINERMRFGIGAYGISGLGVDYRDKIDINPAPGEQGDMFTLLSIMKFAPNLAYQVNPNLSLGANLQIVYGSLDLRNGASHNYAVGGQLGAIYKMDPFSVGFSYTTPENVKHKKVFNFNADLNNDGDSSDPGEDTLEDTLELESPVTYSLGVAYTPMSNLLLELDTKYYGWADAKGYKDFDWDNQTVYALGAQYSLPSGWTLRAGYNFGKSPVKVHNGWDETSVPVFNNEYFRVIGFPAIVEQHITLGVGYQVSKDLQLNLGYMNALENTIKETSAGGATLESSLSEQSYEFALTWNY